MFAVPTEPYKMDADFVEALNLLLIVHADHEQNCSTSTVRMVGSSNANIFASISAGIGALWGPLHGGANQACVEMLERIIADGGDVGKYVDMAKDKNNPFRLMGFGHRVYKNHDPRAKLIRVSCDKLLKKIHRDDPIFDVAKQLEEVALNDPYFIEKKLYPNVDFYSGVIYRAIGISDPDVYRLVCHGPSSRLDCPLEGDAGLPYEANLQAAAGLPWDPPHENSSRLINDKTEKR